MRVLILNQVCTDRRRFWSSISGDLQQTQQFLRLFFVQIDKANSESHSVTMMPNFTFEVKPVVIRKEHTKRNYFAGHHLAHGIEVTAAFRKIRDACGMSFFAAMPHRIQMNA